MSVGERLRQQVDTAILAEMTVERDGIASAQALHDHEAERISEGRRDGGAHAGEWSAVVESRLAADADNAEAAEQRIEVDGRRIGPHPRVQLLEHGHAYGSVALSQHSGQRPACLDSAAPDQHRAQSVTERARTSGPLADL